MKLASVFSRCYVTMTPIPKVIRLQCVIRFPTYFFFSSSMLSTANRWERKVADYHVADEFSNVSSIGVVT